MANWVYTDGNAQTENALGYPKQEIPNEIRQTPWYETFTGHPQDFIMGVAGGLRDMWAGASQLGADIGESVGILSPNTAAQINERALQTHSDIEAMSQGNPSYGRGEAVGKTLPLLAIPGGQQTALGRLGMAAGTGALGGALDVVGPEDSRALNMLRGGGMGLATGGLLEAGGKMYNTLTHPLPDTKTNRLADQWDIPLTLSERQTGQASKTDVLMERLPRWMGGTRGFRAEQQHATASAAKQYLGQYIADPAAADAAAANNQFIDRMYERTRRLVSQIPEKWQRIKPDLTRQAAKDLLDNYADIFQSFQNTKVRRLLQEIVGDTDPVVTAHMPKGGVTPRLFLQPKTLTWDEAWALRKGLGDMVGQANKQAASGLLDKTAASQFKRMFAAIDDDMAKWTESIQAPGIMNTFRVANESYRQFRVRYSAVQSAYDKSMKQVGDGEFFSPALFSNNLRKIAEKDKHLQRFTGPQIDEMSGLANILQVAKRAGQYLENPPTGNRWGLPTTAAVLEGASYKVGGWAGAAKTAGLGAGVGWMARFLTTSPMGQRLAMAASKVEPVSREMQSIMNQVYKALPRFMAESSGMDWGKINSGEKLDTWEGVRVDETPTTAAPVPNVKPTWKIEDTPTPRPTVEWGTDE